MSDQARAAPMRFRILGRVTITEEGQRPLVLTPLARQAVCTLLLNAGTLLQADQLAAAIWESDGPGRIGQVKTLISEIRRALTVDRLPYGREGYELRLLPGDTVDLQEFRALTEQAHRTRGRDAAMLLARAVDLWPEPALTDLPATSSMSAVITALLGERRAARETYAVLELDLGGLEKLLPRLQAWTAQDPLNERLWALALLALYRSGHKAEALRQWDHIQSTLHAEVNAAPGPELRDLAARITTDDPDLKPGTTLPTIAAQGRPEPGPRVNAAAPNVARIYDYLLGGKDNFAADREAADRLIASGPQLAVIARDNRQFLLRAVRFLATERGIRQFLDIGSGLPTQNNVHQVADRAHVVYVDHDPVVRAHAHALLHGNPRTAFLQADLRDPADLLRQVGQTGLLNLAEPVALLLIAILHFIPDTARPHEVVAELLTTLPAGSFLALSHGTPPPDEHSRELTRATFQNADSNLHVRPYDRIEAFFTGLDLLPPGLVPINHWRPHAAVPVTQSRLYAGVARKP